MTAPYYVLEQLFRTVQLHPQKVAVVLDDQIWTYSELIEQIKRTTYYLHRSNYVRGQIVYQFVERSLEMVSGLFGIMCASGVYCPLNPTDPYERITSILEQLRDEILSPLSDVEDIEELPDCEEQGDALIICTSGTTGRHKAVVHSFRSLSTSIRAFSQWDLHVYTSQDQVLQVAACSWILHISEIMLPLVVGGTLVLLRPNDHLDMDYFSQTLIQQQVTTITIGPGITQVLTNYFEKTQRLATLQFVRNVIIGGEAMKPQQLVKLVGVLQSFDIKVCTQYGMTECNGALGGRLLSFDDGFVPMGYPLPGYRCLLIDKQGQTINSTNRSSKIAQLHIGGSALFNRYYNDPERTDNMFVTIDNQIYMKTGDLARYNERGELVHAGRIDFQVKVHGQRVETSEIENTIITWSPNKISNCLVTKAPQNDDFLVAYVVSNDSQIDTEELRQHCSKYLRQYMVPSIFIVLEKLPLNVNGKIDRKNLPIPDFSVLATVANDRRYIEPTGKVEILVHSLWSEILGHSRISTMANFFSIGGHSLLFIRIYQHYRTLFNCDKETINIRTFLDHNTIAEHAKLLENIKINNIQAKQWRTLHISQCIASYAQERIYLDEKMRFPGKVAIYNELDVLQVTKGSLSANRLLQALRCILSKHKILRTSLVFNNDDSTLEQSITDKHLTFALAADQTFKSETDLHSIISQTSTNANLFDLSIGRVFYCQILRQQIIPDENHDKEIITNFDVLIIGFHHVAIDQSTVSIFLHDLCNTYNSNMTWLDDEESLQYIDYSVYERLIDISPSREFWRSQLNGYNQECRLLLPVDRHFLYSDQRSGYASIAHISFDNEVSTSFLYYASSHQVTPFQLCLAIFYAFLFKLTYRQNDLCISCLNANRYRAELQNMIGMFISTLPYRIQVDSDWSFDELVEHVREKCVSILEHSHYPLQHILTDSQLKQSNVPFLETALNFITLSEKSQWFIDTATLEQLPMEQSYGAAKFDFALTNLYNPTSDDSKLSFCLTCSRDLFDQTTAIVVVQRLKHLVDQLFSSKSIFDEIDPTLTSISKLSLILPAEAREIEDAIFCRQQNIVNDAPASFAQARIWLDERIRFDPDKPQVAIYNMPFVYRLQSGHTLSIKQLHKALQRIVEKHLSLQTSLIFDTETNLLMQRIITYEDKNNENNMFSIIESTYETDEQLKEILYDEKRNPQLFDLAQGLVFRCHIIYYKQISSDDLLSDRDVLIFNFHHALFDFPSMEVFLHDLNQAYTTGQLLYDDNGTLRYLDYAVIEQQMSMTGASMFWLDALHNCTLDQLLSLPFDRYRLSNEHRTGRGTSISFDFGQDLSHHFLIYASSSNISLEYLALATYYVFLFKLTNGENDLCIGINTHGRYRDELRSIIGMFVNAIPLRYQLDPHLSFHKLMEHVQDNMINYIKYSYFPLQRILNQHPNISNPVFLDISFEFLSSMRRDEENEIMIGDSHFSLQPYSIKISEDEIMSKFDFILSFDHDLNLNEFSCTINASVDLFNAETICITALRLQTMLHQQFTSCTSKINKPIYELSLSLSNEQYLMQSLNNTQIPITSPPICVHHEFVYQVMKHTQKLAVELDEQSLTYCELLYYVQVLSLALLNEYHVIPGEIVCQCVERSVSMVIGIMAIETVGVVYCPLSSQDPQHRLHALVQQTQNRLVLVHHLTKTKLHDETITLDIDPILIVNSMERNIDIDQLSNINVTSDNIAYITFTSGSTGIPKATQTRHKNLISFIYSLQYVDYINKKDTVMQVFASAFDAHIQEIVGALLSSATVVMLHSYGNMDFLYFANTLENKQITYMASVPSFLYSFCDFIGKSFNSNPLVTLRSLAIGGEVVSHKLVYHLKHYVEKTCCMWDVYGPAETTMLSTIYLIDSLSGHLDVPIGSLLANYQCKVFDVYLQPVSTGEEGELYVGGVGIFAGYLGRDDLTAKALVKIDDELFYQTGDLVTIDNNGLLHYQGRKDHQIKLHGQRIELGEIERCLLNITSISACVVVKWNDDYLVAYVQSSDINEEQLRQHCQSHLPPHMIPSIFIVLEKLPLNQNGKIDRKQLPSPDFSLSTLLSSDKSDTSLSQFEERLHTIWCEVLHCNENHISRTTSFFSVGGHSLLFIQLYHHYQSVFNFDAHTLSIAPFLQQPTIFQHSQLLQTVILNNIKPTQWYTLHINEGVASFAQERIFLDEQVRFSSDIAVYNELFTLQIVQGSLSFSRLLQAFRYVLNKHKILRTSLILNNDNSSLKQCITDIHKTFTITMNQTFENDTDLRDIIHRITINPTFFDLSTGHVFHAEILKHQIFLNENETENNSNEFIMNSDVLLIAFHHAAFDRASFPIFFDVLCFAYNTNAISIEDDDESLQYIDYAVHEHLIDMTTSREFWYSQFEGFNLKRRLSLPIDQRGSPNAQRGSPNDQRSSYASIAQIFFENEISQLFLDYASIHHVTPFQLGLSILYAFLFKLTHGENNLCISCHNANRYRPELQNIIGMFVSTLPYRVELDPHWSFDDLVKYVQEKCLSILEHSHYPLQHILRDFHLNQSTVPFLQTVFDFITVSSVNDQLTFDDVSVQPVSLKQRSEVAKFDFKLTFVYNPISVDNILLCHFICSHDLFEDTTVTKMIQRFQYLFEQIFSMNLNVNQTDLIVSPIAKLTLILPDEVNEMQHVAFYRQSNVTNEGTV
ncbi:unnamed protein product [Adineta steineri]|uniref:Carrier domain-containing protein n=1 Tax=Adineta steineri TaxID=433720 RepID=A0A819PWS0_9BILA|nr:unnamed protein product [Adineta steineri]